ncbi:MAG: hypothetical protein ACYC5O_08820 [Anaerolineae bacterium]
MRLSIGPLSIERQHGRPYLVDGYQLEPTAWVVRAGAASVVVPQAGEPVGRFWAFALVRPSTVKVTDPLGRRYVLGFSRRRALLRWSAGAVAVVIAVAAVRLIGRRVRGRRSV